MKKTFTFASLTAAAALFAGCASDPAPSAPAAAATPAATNMPAASPAKTTAMPMMTDGVSDKECSHVLIEDAPAFTTMPGAQGVAPIGMIKSGTKVLAMVPGSTYTKCMMAGGKTVYVKTSSLKPTTN
jgi:hypothetical protein